ncbi:SLD2 [Candida jiufengensis]|uniref:SLD2 n=1 Tax=Candida jiufengensis TaxID=497108 RepID=UPI0022249CC2|nr:SLD2 [Candida jiufengensis]KAI5951111.1 SLD2 [Candida jiufengensis]
MNDIDVSKIRHQIKDWEHSFQKVNNRQPTKADINGNTEIKNLYSQYKSKKQGKNHHHNSKKATKDHESQLETTNVDKENFPPTPQGELGPTPQANGRVLSIFDYKLTPPESSPLKDKSTTFATNIADTPIRHILKTPVKTNRRLSFTTPNKSSPLASTSTETPPISLIQKLKQTINNETPRYLKSNFQTPTFNRTLSLTEFSTSPSPFKPHRSISFKISEVYNRSLKEAEELKEMEGMFVNEEIEDQVVDEEETSTADPKGNIKKRRTQKRQTRRVKMAPRPVLESEVLDNVNLQEKVHELEEKEISNINAYINSEDEESDDDSQQLVNQVSPSKRTRKPVTENYKRMKINDPRSKRFKQRMRR